MAACELCWSAASFEARLRGGSVVDNDYRLLGENPQHGHGESTS